MSFVYVIEAVGLDLVKLGYARDLRSVAGRFESVRTGCPVDTIHRGVVTVDGMGDEKAMHVALAHARRRGEWFEIGPMLEMLGDRVVPVPLLRCNVCECERPLSAHLMRRGRGKRCQPCTNRRFGDVACTHCNTRLTRKAAEHHRSRGNSQGHLETIGRRFSRADGPKITELAR